MKIKVTERETEYLTQLRRTFHRIPELGFEEHLTSQKVREEMTSFGFDLRTWCGTGVTAVLDSSLPGPTVMLRADMDGLPVQEENTHGFQSRHEGIMHACGHDAHTAILLGVAKVFKERVTLPRGRVVFLFQPAEEGRHGAEKMIEAGVLETYKPDVCAGLHVWSETDAGTCHVCPGPFMAATNRFIIRLQGKGGHGALPHTSKDPIVAGSELVMALQTLVSREVSPMHSAVVTIGQFHGGDSFNVIPDTVTLEGTLRAFDKDVQQHLERRVAEVTHGIAASAGIEAEVDMIRIALPTQNAPEPTGWMQDVVLGHPTAKLAPPGFQTMAGEDMSFFLDRVPGVFFFLGARNEEIGACFPHHHPRFDIDEMVLPLGVELLGEFALHALDKDPSQTSTP